MQYGSNRRTYWQWIFFHTSLNALNPEVIFDGVIQRSSEWGKSWEGMLLVVVTDVSTNWAEDIIRADNNFLCHRFKKIRHRKALKKKTKPTTTQAIFNTSSGMSFFWTIYCLIQSFRCINDITIVENMVWLKLQLGFKAALFWLPCGSWFV